MNLHEGDDPNNFMFVNFNQDSSSLAIGTKTGYKLYSFSSTENLDLLHEDTSEDICIVERLFSSSLVAVVSFSSPRKLKVCHFKKNTEICNYSYSNTILAVKLNRQRLVVCLEESIYIHNIRDMKLLHTIRETPPNPNGLSALSASNDNCLLAYPGSHVAGEVVIFDAFNLQNKIMIPAHDNPLAALAFDFAGTKIATASEKGTVIRVHAVSDGGCIYEFRRGYARCVSIYSLSFSNDAMFLCASSNTETVHIFKLEDPKDGKGNEEPQGWMGWIGKVVSSSTAYLPAQFSEMINQWRSFATAKLPFSGLKNVCTVTMTQKALRVLVASADGYLYIYDLNPNGEPGFECVLLKQHKLGEVDGGPSGIEKKTGTMSYAAVVRGSSNSSPLLPNQLINSSSPTSQFSTTLSPDSSETTTQSISKANATSNYDGDFPPMFHKTSY